MKTTKHIYVQRFLQISFAFVLLFSSNLLVASPTETEEITEFKGMVVDRKSGQPLSFASISVTGTNIVTVSNSEGLFSLKLPQNLLNPTISVSFIGYKNKHVQLSDLKSDKIRIEMESATVQLPELSVTSRNAEELMRAVLDKKGENYFDIPTLMTAFYRETIKKNKSYVSLSEAVVEINKQSYNSYKSDIVRLYKSRKKADYAKLDTLSFKLMGGPFNSLYLDIMKYPDVLFTEDMMANYDFTFDRSTYVDKQLIYVLDFKQKSSNPNPLYYGKLYIDAHNLALKSAVFKLNTTNKEESASMFIMKKPFNARIIPFETNYRIDYQETNGKWYYGYSRIELGLKIIWKKKLFNTNYLSTVEMAVTDWGKTVEKKSSDFKDRLKPSVIISDEASGFSDPQFWGEFNVIEPEKSIDVAIKKIQKQLEK